MQQEIVINFLKDNHLFQREVETEVRRLSKTMSTKKAYRIANKKVSRIQCSQVLRPQGTDLKLRVRDIADDIAKGKPYFLTKN
jgi:hypothetical protein